MDGIAFFRTERLDDVVASYTDRLDAAVWREHPAFTIFRSAIPGSVSASSRTRKGRTVER